MDEIARVFFEREFRLAFYEKKREAFENWFAEIMELRYPGDFKRVRPWGRVGDRKNDGYLHSTRTMFQVYAPNELTEREALKKINRDFEGAVEFWVPHFDDWIFVHNSKDGLSPNISRRLLELNMSGPFTVGQWGFPELRRMVLELDDVSLQQLFRPPPAISDLLNISYTNLERVLQYVAKKPLLDDSEIAEVPLAKLDANGLSDDSKLLISQGNRKSKYVGDFFDNWHEPAYGDEISNSFRQEYLTLKSDNAAPDDILSGLLVFAGFRKVTDPSDIMAVYALVAYLFMACDIFERPLGEHD